METLPPVSVARMRALDRYTIERAGVPGRLLMEAAGLGAYRLLARQLETHPGEIIVLAGKGNNAGDAYVVARYAAADGLPVRVLSVDPPASLAPGDAAANADVLGAFGLVVEPATPAAVRTAVAGGGVVVDGLLGTGLSGSVRPPYAAIIDAVNATGPAVLALDLPSGLCGDRGTPLGTAIQAAWTATFGAVKTGLLAPSAAPFVGRVTLVRLPFPRQAWESIPEPGASEA